jgi:hypothetical protein
MSKDMDYFFVAILIGFSMINTIVNVDGDYIEK